MCVGHCGFHLPLPQHRHQHHEHDRPSRSHHAHQGNHDPDDDDDDDDDDDCIEYMYCRHVINVCRRCVAKFFYSETQS